VVGGLGGALRLVFEVDVHLDRMSAGDALDHASAVEHAVISGKHQPDVRTVGLLSEVELLELGRAGPLAEVERHEPEHREAVVEPGGPEARRCVFEVRVGQTA
jgi:hypothetical protein